VLLEFRLEALEQRERIGGAAGEAREDAVLVQAPDLACGRLDDDVAERDLAVAASATSASRRTESMVVPWKLCMRKGAGASRDLAGAPPGYCAFL